MPFNFSGEPYEHENQDNHSRVPVVCNLGRGAFFFNNTSNTFTDLTVTWLNPVGGALYSNYICLGGGNAFTSCTSPTASSWTWHFSGIDATHLGIAPNDTFALQFGGQQSTSTQFSITPSFEDHLQVLEPATMTLLGSGLLALATMRKRRS